MSVLDVDASMATSGDPYESKYPDPMSSGPTQSVHQHSVRNNDSGVGIPRPMAADTAEPTHPPDEIAAAMERNTR